MRATKRVAIGIVGFAAVGCLTLAGCMTLLFSGGVGNIVKNLKPAPDVDGRRITRKRAEATQAVESALAAVERQSGAENGRRLVLTAKASRIHTSATALAPSTSPAATITTPITRATRSPDGARRSIVMPALTTAIARKSMTPITRRIAVKLAQQ